MKAIRTLIALIRFLFGYEPKPKQLKFNFMDKNLYYTVQTDSTGFMKTIRVYEIIDNKPKIFCMLDANVNDSSKDEIQNYLDDNGYSDETFNLIAL
jgi:hypothetical protein